eukprot:2654777-Pleurochrysis_carterae.AAC.1
MISSRPAALETFRPSGRRSEGARTFLYGTQSFRDPGRSGRRYRLRRALKGYQPCLYLFTVKRVA